MASLATSVGFSPALGAFLMGTILAETSESERIEHLIKPVKDLFAAIFFCFCGNVN
jgi:CPA2 family monovalent cation:H+ antiporter-2